jgi:hypothetical protein
VLPVYFMFYVDAAVLAASEPRKNAVGWNTLLPIVTAFRPLSLRVGTPPLEFSLLLIEVLTDHGVYQLTLDF